MRSWVAYSIATYIHWHVAKHRGVETCNRISLMHVHIIQGFGLYKEIADSCFRCRIKRGKYLEASMGPISDHQLTICPPFWTAQVDIFGPVKIFAPGFSYPGTKVTRTPNLQAAYKTIPVCKKQRLLQCYLLWYALFCDLRMIFGEVKGQQYCLFGSDVYVFFCWHMRRMCFVVQ